MASGEVVYSSEDPSDPSMASPMKSTSDKHDTFASFYTAPQITEKIMSDKPSNFDSKGSIQRAFVEKIAGENGSKVQITPHFPENYPKERIERVMATQEVAQAVHMQLSASKQPGWKQLIPSDEKVLMELETAGYLNFPNFEDELAGPGSVILTDKYLYFYWSYSKYEAAAEENLAGTTWCSCPVNGSCGCFQCCRVYTGKYSHLGVRELQDRFSYIPTEHLTPGGVKIERSDRFKIERSVDFSRSCKRCNCCDCCCCWKCCSCFQCCIYHGQMLFRFKSELIDSKSLEAKIITKIKNSTKDEEAYDSRFRFMQIRYLDLASNKVLEDGWVCASVSDVRPDSTGRHRRGQRQSRPGRVVQVQHDPQVDHLC
eukprot:765868-Hanusia_phi.AAC.1